MSKLFLSTFLGLVISAISGVSHAQDVTKTVKVHYQVMGKSKICEGDSTMPVQAGNTVMHANSPQNLVVKCTGALPDGQVAEIALYGVVEFGDDGNFYLNAALDLNQVTPVQTGALVLLAVPVSIANHVRFVLANDGTSISNQSQTVIATVNLLP